VPEVEAKSFAITAPDTTIFVPIISLSQLSTSGRNERIADPGRHRATNLSPADRSRLDYRDDMAPDAGI
jgi:hypothetical protein